MAIKKIVLDLWGDLNRQNWDNLSSYFSETATINWHDSNERFSVDEFVFANSHYPGNWQINIEKLISIENIVISVVKVSLKESDISFHATSFFEFENDKIKTLDEYWGEDGIPPQWRIDMKIGKPIC